MVKKVPVKILPDGVDIEPKRTGHRYTDMIVAGAAILISLVSLGVAVKHGLIMERLVAANSWPLLQYGTGNIDMEKNIPRIDLMIENVGVGPAVVRKFSVFYQGKEYKNANKLLADCCGFTLPQNGNFQPDDPKPVTSLIEGTVIKAGEERLFLSLVRTGDSEVWKRLDKARFELKFDACYCSVFNECWHSDITGIDPEPVQSCPVTIDKAAQTRAN